MKPIDSIEDLVMAMAIGAFVALLWHILDMLWDSPTQALHNFFLASMGSFATLRYFRVRADLERLK